MTPEIVLGPPGTGKTTTLLGYVDDELARGVPPDQIGYISFTRRAAQEAAERAQRKFSLSKRDLPWFRTIHSLCFAALGLTSSDVLEGTKLRDFGDWIGVKVSGKMSLEEGSVGGFEVGDRILFMENLARVRGTTIREQYDAESDDQHWPMVDKVVRGLAQYKADNHLLDFTDMLELFVRSEWRVRLRVLLVDEAQDLSILQWRVVEKLAQGAERVVVAGDDDQAIYRWAGAAVEHFVGMAGRERVLRQSWRVPESVRAVAMDALSPVRERRAKEWMPREGAPGEVVRVPNIDALDFAAGEQVLVLARNACFLHDDAMPLLRKDGIVYEYRGAGSVRSAVVEAILDWERLRRGERILATEARRVYELMSVGVGYVRGSKKLPGLRDDEEVSAADLRERGGLLASTDLLWHDALDRLEADDRAYMLKALRRGEKLTRRPSVRLSTIHGSKGGEADHVVLYRDLAARTERERRMWPEDEARCWYVAATRARQRLTIVAPQTRRSYDI